MSAAPRATPGAAAAGDRAPSAPDAPAGDRRAFLAGALGLAAAIAVDATTARRAAAQQPAQQNFGPMEQDAYRPVLRPAKPDATPLLTDDQRDALEHKLKCQCGCILDVYTCRTTDFTCQVSPAMHRDVMRLIAGGYSEREILDAFVETYGEVALTAPKKEGFNWAGYLAPGIAMAAGALALTLLLRKWAAEARAAAAARGPAGAVAAAVPEPGTPAFAASIPGVSRDELDRLERALREDA